MAAFSLTDTKKYLLDHSVEIEFLASTAISIAVPATLGVPLAPLAAAYAVSAGLSFINHAYFYRELKKIDFEIEVKMKSLCEKDEDLQYYVNEKNKLQKSYHSTSFSNFMSEVKQDPNKFENEINCRIEILKFKDGSKEEAADLDKLKIKKEFLVKVQSLIPNILNIVLISGTNWYIPAIKSVPLAIISNFCSAGIKFPVIGSTFFTYTNSISIGFVACNLLMGFVSTMSDYSSQRFGVLAAKYLVPEDSLQKNDESLNKEVSFSEVLNNNLNYIAKSSLTGALTSVLLTATGGYKLISKIPLISMVINKQELGIA